MLALIDERVDARCMVTTMNKQGCTVDTDDAPVPCRVIDMDHSAAPADPSDRKCDYLFLAADAGRRRILVVPLELKSTGLNPASVVAQLLAGAGVAEQPVRGISPVRFVPVAVHGGRVHRRQYQELRTKRIRFRNNDNEIVTMPCGSPLTAALA